MSNILICDSVGMIILKSYYGNASSLMYSKAGLCSRVATHISIR